MAGERLRPSADHLDLFLQEGGKRIGLIALMLGKSSANLLRMLLENIALRDPGPDSAIELQAKMVANLSQARFAMTEECFAVEHPHLRRKFSGQGSKMMVVEQPSCCRDLQVRLLE